MVLEYEYKGLPRGVCNIIDILIQGIQNIPGVCTYMYIIASVHILTKNNNKNNIKELYKFF